MTLLVRYFAGAAAAARVEEETVELVDGATAGDLRRHLGSARPALIPVLAISSLLIDGVQSRDDAARLGAASQVDVLPPFAGG